MTISEIAGRLLKGTGHTQPPPDKGQPFGSDPPSERTSGSSFLTSSELDHGRFTGCRGIVSTSFGDPRGHSIASSWAKTRPLSDIREITEPSLAGSIPRIFLSDNILRSASRIDQPSSTSKHQPSIQPRVGENREPERENSPENSDWKPGHQGQYSRTPSPHNCADNNSISSVHTIPPGSVPPRSSSRTRVGRSSTARQQGHKPPLQTTQRLPPANSLDTAPSIPLVLPRGSGNTIPRRGRSHSPLRQVAARLDPVAHDTHRRIPSRTFIRETPSKDLLEFPTHRHPRIELGLDLSAGIFVGGGSIEGVVQIKVDDAERIRHRRTLDIARISIDLLGLEEVSWNRRCVFLNLATELLNEDNPPPQNMVDTQEPIGSEDLFWHLMPSVTNLAFNLSLPLNVGPPPFHSKNARIRYVLCVSLLIRDHGKQYIVRTSEDVMVLSVYDPEKALMSLPSPLTASDEWLKPRETTLEAVRVTAGLHRQVWVSGTSIYVDVHIVNNSRRTIKKIELQLERDILYYKHAAASTIEKSASQARIFDDNERSTLSKASIKHGSTGWHGVPAHQTYIRTCDLELPRGHATVKCGKYFEVRYFLNVVVGSAHTKLVTVQLPIVLIHMNSLDVVPNSVAQVAMAIEEKRTAHTYQRLGTPLHLSRHPSQPVQGRAFAAPRMQSLERMRAQSKEIRELSEVLDQSPRRYGVRRTNSNWDYRTPPSNRKGRIVGDSEAAELRRRLRKVRSNDNISLRPNIHRQSSPKSRRSAASALGFREAEVREDMELAGWGQSSEAPFKQRLEQSRERQYRFSKKRSVERWKGVASAGVGWLKGTNGAKEEQECDDWNWAHSHVL